MLTYYVLGVKAVWPKVPIGHIRQTYTGSKVYLDYLLPWTKTCAAEHPICRNDHESFIPRRVLDVGGDDGSQVRLLETQAAEKSERYICLSHMWGTSKPIQTTQSNMADHIAGIPLMALPLTFRDAVKITRYLGVRFLWIDSLCIVQDDNDDWVTQSAQMANIYGKSFLTISATISEDAHGGIFKRIPHDAGHIEVPHHVNLKESTGVFVGSVISHEQFENLTPSALAGQCQKWDSQYPLLGRAWAYQEQVLSPRVIFFGHHEIFWQCNVTSWCCCSPYPVQHALKHTIAHALDTGTTRSTKTNLDILLCWAQIVRSYCEKSITKEEDRLPALSGIAKRFQSVRNSRYLAGLWEDNLITDLCWVAGKLSRRPRKYLAPSWSWCSVFGWTTSNYALEIGGDDLTVREVSCTPSTSDPTGAVSSGFIRLSGFLLQGKAVIPSNDTSPTFRVQGMENEFYPDALNDDLAAIQASNYTVYGLKICYETSMPDLPMLCVLVLLKKDRSEDQYQRVGLASLPIDTWDNKFEKKCTITII
jgi:hypothetical protein